MTSAIETIAAWSHSASAFSPLARRRAIDAIADTFGCMVAGVDDFSSQAVRRAVATQISASGESPVIGGGRALVDAYVVGLEAQAAVGIGVNPSHYTAGWHSTSTCGAIGTAAGVSRLMGLDAAAMARAMSMAVSLASGIKGQFGTPAKPFHAGMAARNAVEAAALGRAGMTGRFDILETAQGFRDLFGGPDAAGWDGLSLGQPPAIESHGVIPKRHPW